MLRGNKATKFSSEKGVPRYDGDSSEDWAGKSALSETSPLRGNHQIKVVVCVLMAILLKYTEWQPIKERWTGKSALGETSPLPGNPRIKVVVCVVLEIRVKIEPESPLSVRPARYEGTTGLR